MTELIKQKKQVPERLYSNKKLAALLIPLALDQLLNSFMGTIDTLVVSNLGCARFRRNSCLLTLSWM